MAEILSNSKATHDYQIVETFEAGVVLRGSEVKALRSGKGQISDAFAKIEKGEVWLHNAHIDEYPQANNFGHSPRAPRKLLLHRSEIRKLLNLVLRKGNALLPLSVYWKNGKVKVSLAVGRGKLEFDRRDDIKTREADREIKRATTHRMKKRPE